MPRGAKIALGIAGALLLGAGLVWFLYQLLNSTTINASDTVQQVLWVIVGIVILLLVLLAYSVVNVLTDPDNRRAALGLPEGSVGAVIALMILFIFSLSFVFVFTQVQVAETSGQVSTGLTLEDVQELPPDRILKVERRGDTEPATYDVTLTGGADGSLDIGRTSLATISTLLVAIVGFYFGQRSAATSTQQGVDLATSVAGKSQASQTTLAEAEQATMAEAAKAEAAKAQAEAAKAEAAKAQAEAAKAEAAKAQAEAAKAEAANAQAVEAANAEAAKAAEAAKTETAETEASAAKAAVRAQEAAPAQGAVRGQGVPPSEDGDNA